MGIRQIKEPLVRQFYRLERFTRRTVVPRVRAFSKWSARKVHAYALIPAWIGVRFGYKHGKRGAKFTHKHVAQRPHEHLQKKVTWYKNWHEWEHHHRVHVGVTAVYLLIAVSLLTVGIRNALAASDLIDTWDFSNSSLFDYDSGVETSGSSARFKAQNYASDANTMGLFHLDEASGTTATDSSSNHNNVTSSTPPTFGTGILNNGATFDGRDDIFRVSDSSALSFNFANSIEAWTKFDTNFSNGSHDEPQTVVDKGSYKLFYDNTSGKINYEMANAGANTWSQVGGGGLNGSWGTGHTGIASQTTDGTNVYVGLFGNTGGAVWMWNGTAWTRIGGGGLNGSWNDVIETVTSMTYGNGKLYVGLGQDTNDAAVWEWNGSSWTKIAGSGINNGWTTAHENVTSLSYTNGKLYAGVGTDTNDARVYEWNGTAWTWIGGFGVTGYTAFPTGYERVTSLVGDGTRLYAGLGSTAGDGDMWVLNGTTWTQIGGDGVNSSWAAATYESIWSAWYQGSTLYAGLGQSSNDAEVWSWNGTTWTQIGGDSLNGGWGTNFETVRSLTGDGTNIYAGIGDSGDDDELWMWNGTSWSKVGGDGVNGSFNNTVGVADASQVSALTFMNGGVYAGLYGQGGDFWRLKDGAWTRLGGDGVNASWGMSSMQSAEAMTSWNGKLYAGLGFNLTSAAVVWEYDGSSWRMIGGQGLNGSWAWDEFEGVNTLIAYKGALYAGLGSGTGDAEVWRYDGSTWTKVGGDTMAWNTGYEIVQTMAVNDGKLYAGLGNHGGDGEVWAYDGSTWTKVGGDAVNGSWGATAIYERVTSLSAYKDDLYAGIGTSAGDAELWKMSGGTWTKVGGDGLNNSWADTTFEQVLTQVVHDGELYIGLGVHVNESDLWKYDGANWSQVGGDGINGSWSGRMSVFSLASYNGDLYAGLGEDGAYSEVWRLSNGSWSQVGGDSLNLSWNTAPETVRSMAVHQGRLFAGLGHDNADSVVWSYGNNASLTSNANTQDTGWHHIAASYDGTRMKIFIDGVENASKAVSNLMPDTHHQLFIGAGHGSLVPGMSDGHFKGQLDEVRISNTARTGFTTRPYVTTKQLVTLKNAIRQGGVKSWDSFSASETLNGGTIGYRLSADGGTTWQYWDSGEWKTSASPDHANTAAIVDNHISDFPVTFGGLKWQAVMQGDGFQRVTLNSVEVQASSDSENPSANASNIQAQKTNGGSALAADAWTNGGAPYFAWDEAEDDGGIKGYCLYVGQDTTADPAFTKGLLGVSPLSAGGHCQFLLDGTSLDLASPGYVGTPLSTSSAPYVLRIRAIDHAGNLSDDTAQFQFKFDNTPPNNPAFVTAPSGVIMDKEATLTWPTSGGNAAQDAQSGVAGLQYRINDTVWYGDAHSGTGDGNDLLVNDGTYTTQDPPDYDNMQDGVNTVYFRTWDQAGNVATSFVTAAVRLNTTGAPTEPQNITVNPNTNTVNAFAFDWDAPATFAGDESKLTYCYTVNTLPSASTCTYTSPGVTGLGAGPYATQPGSNTFYIVARDEMNNVNYSSVASRSFTANTPSPGIPVSVDVVDVSVKASATWRLALTWDRPTNTGAGIASYRVYRSTDSTNFTQVGSSASTTYIDAGLSQQRYYYRIVACDNTNNCGAVSAVVDDMPTGRFTEPASLVASPNVTDITTKKARIAWVTSRESDSRIALGTKSGEYSSSEVTVSKQVTAHTVELDNLSAGTTYYYVAKWTDEDGNTGQSQEYTFTTSPAPSLKEIQTIRVGLTSAVVQFTSRNAVRASVYYGTSESFGGVVNINTSMAESLYNVELNGLNDGAKYYYKVVTYDNEGTAYDGSVFSLTTPSRPRISNVRFEPIEGEPTSTQRITWQTNVPANSAINYGKLNTAGSDILQSALVTSHEIIVRDLEDNSEYFVVAQSRDANGNIAVSDRQQFKTALDTRAPKVHDITVESSIRGTGAEARGQIVVSWRTDEPATSQVAYGEGSGLQEFNNRTSEDTALSTEHIVIVSDLPPSRVYSVRPVSADASGNSTNGTTKSAIIGRAPDGITTIVFDALRRIFGY